MITFESEKVTDRITRIHSFTGEQMYLVEGSKRAALIDTGTGVGDLKAFVAGLTELPLVVIITHGHIDHAIGAAQFGGGYMSFLDIDTYRERCTYSNREQYLSSSPLYCTLEDGDRQEICPPGMFRNLEDGAKFDLGGVSVEAVACGGHSPGSMMMMIPEDETLITGDACNYFTMLQGDTCLGLSTYEKNLKAAKERTAGRYKRICLSHGRMTPPLSLMDEVIEVCEDIKAGRDDRVPYIYMGVTGFVAKAYGKNELSSYARKDGGFGNIVYNPETIFE